MSGTELALAIAVVALGAAVQGSVGFGANLVAAPLLTLIDPSLVPVPIVVAALASRLLTGRLDRGHTRLAVLALSGISALAVLFRHLG